MLGISDKGHVMLGIYHKRPILQEISDKGHTMMGTSDKGQVTQGISHNRTGLTGNIRQGTRYAGYI